jgi:hypothetical protein
MYSRCRNRTRQLISGRQEASEAGGRKFGVEFRGGRRVQLRPQVRLHAVAPQVTVDSQICDTTLKLHSLLRFLLAKLPRQLINCF